MIVLIDNYDSFTFNLAHQIGRFEKNIKIHRNDKVSVDEVLIENPEMIVISPGPCTPDDAGICVDLINKAIHRIPVFGVCLGYQSIGQAMGGRVVKAPSLFHGRTSLMVHNGHRLFTDIPHEFSATRYHSLMLEEKSIPPCFEVCANTTDGLPMAIAHKQFPCCGVLFHPESHATEYGDAIIRNFIAIAREWNKTQGRIS